jgi:FkbM family methyltransferase
MTLRAVVERLARGRTLKRRLPGRFAPTELYVSPDAQLKYVKPGVEAFDADLLRVVDTQIREDSIVWDIGANVGVFTFAAASVARKGMTLAVEPDIWLTQLLRRSQRLRKNVGLNVVVLPAAVADRDGIATFTIARRGRASNALESVGGRTESGGARETQTVPTLTLDTLLDFTPAPTFVKVDVEGAEALALRGAQRLLRDVRPTVYIEVGQEHSDEVAKRLTDHGYALFDGAQLANEARGPTPNCAFNTLAIPR